MTEEDAKGWVAERFPERAVEVLRAFVTLVTAENDRQNLIAPSTVETIWTRHVVDSAQLLGIAGSPSSWIDVGTGGGFPGMVVAILGDFPVTMIEPRRRRAEFLQSCVQALGLEERTRVELTKVENVEATASVISARAVASIEKILQATAHCATPETRWILPRGRLDPDQLSALRRLRGKMFHVEHSLTDPESTILIVEAKR